MTRVLIASTIPAFKMAADGHYWHWLTNAHEITKASAAQGIDVDWLCVLQTDARGLQPFQPIQSAINELDGHTISFSLDLGIDEWTSSTRLTGICIGRNLMIDHALREGHDWIYFADSDIQAPDDILPKLLELDWPVCGAHVPTYAFLRGMHARAWHSNNGRHSTDPHQRAQYAAATSPEQDEQIRAAGHKGDVCVHWTTAGSLLLHRDAFRRVPWRHDPDLGETDDPATQHELARLGWPTLVRHDIICQHHPQQIGPLEDRGHDLTIHR